MTSLPSNWMEVKIVEVLELNSNGKPFQQGWSPQCEKEPAAPGNWGVLKTTAIQEGEFRSFENKALPENSEPRPHIEVRDGDVLMTCAGPRNRCGITCIVKETPSKLMMSGKMYRFRPDRKMISPKYLVAYLHSRSARQAIDKMKTGISDSGLNLTHGRFADLAVPLPPLAEQQRILQKIEEVFSELDKSLQNLTLARTQIELLYKTVLDRSFAQLKKVEKLKSLLSTKLSNGYSGKPVKHKTKHKVLTLTSTTSGEFDGSHYKYLEEEGLESRDIWCEPRDILVQRGNTPEYVGIPALYTGKSRQYIFPDLMIRVRANEEKVSTKFLYYALLSPALRNRVRAKAKGSAGTMPKINQAILNDLDIPICDTNLQDKITSDIDMWITNIFSARAVITENIRKAETLRQSILMKAFAGQLVEQRTNDEPASKLLARIKDKKEGHGKAKTVGKEKTKRKTSRKDAA